MNLVFLAYTSFILVHSEYLETALDSTMTLGWDIDENQGIIEITLKVLFK